MSEVDFTKRMSLVPDEELIAVVSGDGFVPAAVDAARLELERRNLGHEEVARISADIEDLRRFKGDRSSIPLSLAGKIAFFVFSPALLWIFVAVLVLAFRGYGRKFNDGLKWMAMGLAFWGAIAVAIAFT